MKKIKILTFVILIISFIVILFYGIFGINISFKSMKEIKENKNLNNDLITDLKINNVDTVYDKNNNTFYYTIPNNYENKTYILNFNLDNSYKYKIVDETLNIVKVDYNKNFKIIIYNDKYYFETNLQLTNLPIINIRVESKITTDPTDSIFKYINSEEELTNNIKIHVRGSSSMYFDKQSYKVKMYNKNYTDEININLNNFYTGNAFILDAVYRDPSKIRNIICTQIWNDISNDYNNIDVYSEFVELFINNEYKGIYVFTEPINRRKLKLNKTGNDDSSILVKIQNWEYIDSDVNVNDITDDAYFGFELKYPNDEELYAKSWKTILSKIVKYYDNEIESNYKTITSTFNLQNYIDLIIFNAFTNNIDNRVRKNNYMYMEDFNSNEVYIQPWDMEYTFGTRYKGAAERNLLKNMEDYNEIYTGFYHENAPEINKLLIERYWGLRKDILTKEYFDNLLNKYLNELNKGAALRDSKLWYEYDIEKEIEEIRTWIYNRIEFFDEYVKGLENEKS